MMKRKIIISLSVTIAVLMIKAQSFTSGSLLLHFNAGIEVVNTEYTYQLKKQFL